MKHSVSIYFIVWINKLLCEICDIYFNEEYKFQKLSSYYLFRLHVSYIFFPTWWHWNDIAFAHKIFRDNYIAAISLFYTFQLTSIARINYILIRNWADIYQTSTQHCNAHIYTHTYAFIVHFMILIFFLYRMYLYHFKPNTQCTP